MMRTMIAMRVTVMFWFWRRYSDIASQVEHDSNGSHHVNEPYRRMHMKTPQT